MVAPVDDRLLGLVASTLVGSPFQRRSRWSSAVVILRVEEKRVTSRADFASWLRANDLRPAARECMARRLHHGNVLVWIDVDAEAVAVAGFLIVDLDHAISNRTETP